MRERGQAEQLFGQRQHARGPSHHHPANGTASLLFAGHETARPSLVALGSSQPKAQPQQPSAAAPVGQQRQRAHFVAHEDEPEAVLRVLQVDGALRHRGCTSKQGCGRCQGGEAGTLLSNDSTAPSLATCSHSNHNQAGAVAAKVAVNPERSHRSGSTAPGSL